MSSRVKSSNVLIPVVMRLKDAPVGALISPTIDLDYTHEINPTYRNAGRAMMMGDEVRPSPVPGKMIIHGVTPVSTPAWTEATLWVDQYTDVMMLDDYLMVVVFLAPEEAIKWVNKVSESRR